MMRRFFLALLFLMVEMTTARAETPGMLVIEDNLIWSAPDRKILDTFNNDNNCLEQEYILSPVTFESCLVSRAFFMMAPAKRHYFSIETLAETIRQNFDVQSFIQEKKSQRYL